MVTVKMLKPYYIKADSKSVRVILANQYFSILINDDLYHFVPIEAREIKVDRKTKRIVNIKDRFSFKRGKDIIYIKMTELIGLPDFLIQLYFIIESYYAQKKLKNNNELSPETRAMIKRLEELNIKRLIDKSLDDRDEETFRSLVKLL